MTSQDLIISQELLKDAELQVNKGHLKKNDATEDPIDAPVNVIEMEKLDIGPVNQNIRDQVVKLLNSYKPNKTRTTDVKIKIIVTDDLPTEGFHILNARS